MLTLKNWWDSTKILENRKIFNLCSLTVQFLNFEKFNGDDSLVEENFPIAF